jgi:hypothetical protein
MPGQITSVPGMRSRIISSFTDSAAAMFTAWPVLWPSPWPGAPATSGSRKATPGLLFDCGMPSTSEPIVITGRAPAGLTQRATQALGIPA